MALHFRLLVLRLLMMLHAVTYDQIAKCVLYMFCGHIANFLIVSLLEIFIPIYCLLTLGVRMRSEGYGSRSVCLFVCRFVCLSICLRLFSDYRLRGGMRYSATRQFVSTTALHLRRGFCTLVLFILHSINFFTIPALWQSF